MKPESNVGTGKTELQNTRDGRQGAVGLSAGTQPDPNAHVTIGVNGRLLAPRAEFQAQPPAMAGATTAQLRRGGGSVGRFVDAGCSKARGQPAWSCRTSGDKAKASGLPLADQTTSISKGRDQEIWASEAC